MKGALLVYLTPGKWTAAQIEQLRRYQRSQGVVWREELSQAERRAAAHAKRLQEPEDEHEDDHHADDRLNGRRQRHVRLDQPEGHADEDERDEDAD